MFFSMFVSVLAMASGKGHKAHSHGHGALNIAVDGSTAVILFESPADSIYGFEHEAKSAADVKKRDLGVATLKQNFAKLVQFSLKSECVLENTKMEAFVAEKESDHESHGEVHAEWSVKCKKDLSGSSLKLEIPKELKRLQSIEIQVISKDKQKGGSIRFGTPFETIL